MDHLNSPDLSTVRDSEMETRYLTFLSNDQLFAVSIADIVQIVGIQEITPLPEFPAYVKGIINLRGDILPIIDMRLRMGNPEAPYTERSCIIVAKIRNTLFGFIADRVEEVLDISPEQISPPPRLAGSGASEYLSGIGRLGMPEGEKVVLLLDLPKFFSENELSVLAEVSQPANRDA